MSRAGMCIAVLLLAGCGRPEPPPSNPSRQDMVRVLAGRRELRDAISAYATAQTPDEVRACLPALEKIASGAGDSLRAARARFTIGHAWAYSLSDTAKAIEQFQAVVKLVPSEALADLAKEQIEVLAAGQQETSR